MDASAVYAMLEGLLSVRGARKRLARRVSIRLETLARILDPMHPKRASWVLAGRIAEALVEEFGLPPAQTRLVRDYLRYKSRFCLSIPLEVPQEGPYPDPYWIRRRMNDLVELYRKAGATLSLVRDPGDFREVMEGFLQESRELLRMTATWMRRSDTPLWLREGYMQACTLAGVAHAVAGYLVESAVYADRAVRLAREMMAMAPPRREEDRIRMANGIFGALTAPLIPMYLAGAYRRVAEGHVRNQGDMQDLGCRWHLPGDLVHAWVLDCELKRLHSLSGITRFRLSGLFPKYRDAQ